jgi:nucleoside-diphosphate-sugar epimerase
MSRVFVTGAGGFVGANLARRLLADGHDVVAAIHARGDDWRLSDLSSEIRCIQLDVRDQDAVSTAFRRERPETIFHLAANGAYSWQQQREVIFATNLAGTVNVLQAGLRHGSARFVLAGTSSEYGYRDHAPREDEAPEPNSDYAVAKAAATLYAGHVGRTEAIGVSILRLYSVYGPWEEPGRLLPALVVAGRSAMLPPLASPEIARDFVYVDDACDAFVRATTSPGNGEIYNVGSGSQTTLAELVEVVRRCLAVEAEPQWNSMAARAWDTGTWVADPTRIRAELGWSAATSLEEGIEAMARWLERSPRFEERYQQAD